jgi:hypothetical protein
VVDADIIRGQSRQLDCSRNLKITYNGNCRTDTGKNDNYFGRISFDDLKDLSNTPVVSY